MCRFSDECFLFIYFFSPQKHQNPSDLEASQNIYADLWGPWSQTGKRFAQEQRSDMKCNI